MASKNVETFRAAFQAFNRRDFDAVLRVIAEDAIFHDRARDVTFKGRNGFREFMQGWVTAFSNAEVVEPKFIDAGDIVVAEFIGRGLNDGPLGPLPPTGKQLSLHFCEIMWFNDGGQIVSGAEYYDQLSMMVQLGHALPAQAAAAG